MTDLTISERDCLPKSKARPDEAALEALRVAALGKKGRRVRASEDARRDAARGTQEQKGPLINGLRDKVQAAIATRKDALAEAALEERLAAERLDVTLPVRKAETRGRIHPISQVIDELTAIFADMGFAIAEGPDIETDYYNFTALNFPIGHPAQEMHDTFFLAPDRNGERKVLRTHTSPVQIRTMKAQQPPIRVIIPGRTYRHDSDQTHTPMFHQVEGLVIDTSSNIAHMKWVLEEFCKAFFEVDQVRMRFRPSFFPFTEPSEVDIQCSRQGSEIRFGEGNDWLEILGCGMVHPNVLGIAASTPTTTRASPGASASTASPCSNTACRTCAPSSRRTCAGSTITASGRSTCRRSRAGSRHEVHLLLAQGPSRDARDAGRNRDGPDPHRPRGRARRGQGGGARRLHRGARRLGGAPPNADRCGCAWWTRARASRCRWCAAPQRADRHDKRVRAARHYIRART